MRSLLYPAVHGGAQGASCFGAVSSAAVSSGGGRLFQAVFSVSPGRTPGSGIAGRRAVLPLTS